MTEVLAALIWDKDKFMICQRPAQSQRPPVGVRRRKSGARREQRAGTHPRVPGGVGNHPECVGKAFMDVTYQYPDLTVHLTLFHVAILEGVPQKLEHNDIQWITADEIDQYEFCPANVEILERLKTAR